MATLDEKVARLTDQQALSVVDSLSGEFGLDETPEAKEPQIKALEALFKREGHAAGSDAAAAAAVARQLMLMMAQVPEARQQALSIVESLTGEFAPDETPEAKKAQIKALEALFKREGHAADSDAAATAAVARRLLLMMAQVPEFRPSLDERLDHPPKENPTLIPGQPLALIFIGAALVFIPLMPPPSPRR